MLICQLANPFMTKPDVLKEVIPLLHIVCAPNILNLLMHISTCSATAVPGCCQVLSFTLLHHATRGVNGRPQC